MRIGSRIGRTYLSPFQPLKEQEQYEKKEEKEDRRRERKKMHMDEEKDEGRRMEDTFVRIRNAFVGWRIL